MKGQYQLTIEQQEKLDEVMDYFDFGRVVKVMEALDWEWAFEDFTLEEPYIRNVVRGLIKRAFKDGHINTGGFDIKYSDDFLCVKFVAAEWDVW